MAQKPTKTARITDLAEFNLAKKELESLLGTSVSDAFLIACGIAVLREKMNGLLLPPEFVARLVTRQQGALLKQVISDLCDQGFPLDNIAIQVDEQAGKIVVNHAGNPITESHAEAPIAGAWVN